MLYSTHSPTYPVTSPPTHLPVIYCSEDTDLSPPLSSPFQGVTSQSKHHLRLLLLPYHHLLLLEEEQILWRRPPWFIILSFLVFFLSLTTSVHDSEKTLFWQRSESAAAAIHLSTSSPVLSSRCRLTHDEMIQQRSIAGGTQVTTSSQSD